MVVCLFACLLVCLFAGLLAFVCFFLLACLLACLFFCLFVCWLVLLKVLSGLEGKPKGYPPMFGSFPWLDIIYLNLSLYAQGVFRLGSPPSVFCFQPLCGLAAAQFAWLILPLSNSLAPLAFPGLTEEMARWQSCRMPPDLPPVAFFYGTRPESPWTQWQEDYG